jgi:hypothetical protein
VLLFPPFIFLALACLKLLIQLHFSFHSLFLPHPAFLVKRSPVLFKEVFEELVVVVVVVVQCNHALESGSFILFIVEITPLRQLFNTVIDVLELTGLLFGIQVLSLHLQL